MLLSFYFIKNMYNYGQLTATGPLIATVNEKFFNFDFFVPNKFESVYDLVTHISAPLLR
jgi:hypothetical protein